MKIDILAFGIAKEIVNGSSILFEIEEATSIKKLKEMLSDEFPDFKRLRSLAIAVNSEYKQDNYILQARDEVVIIPPVSGG